jgi:large subunit ribosomal protein L18
MNSKKNEKVNARLRKKKHIKQRVFGTAERPRLVVYKSLKHIYAQLVDDVNQKTITGMSSLSKDLQDEIAKAKNNIQKAEVIGTGIAKKALDLKIDKVVFDRNGYIYHGRVKAIAESARKSGIKF